MTTKNEDITQCPRCGIPSTINQRIKAIRGAEMARRYREGQTVDSIAAHFEVSAQCVYFWLVKLGAKMRTPGRPKKKAK